MRTIAIVNQKGGCGKTTTAINLSAVFAHRGLRTLLVDMDPQSHCAIGLGVPERRIELSIGEALLDDGSGQLDATSLVWEVAGNLDLIPSTMRLAGLEAPGGGLHELSDRDRRLAGLLQRFTDQYDRCVIDCPPTIGLLTFNALRAAPEALIPVETGFFALRGAGRQWRTIRQLVERLGQPIACHLVPTLYDADSPMATDILAALRREFAGQVLPLVIREEEVVREAVSFGQPVIEYAPQSNACRDFEQLADWLEDHPPRATVQIEVISGQHKRPAAVPGAAGPPRSSGIGSAPAGPIGRAAELARRVRDLQSQSLGDRGGFTHAAQFPAAAPPRPASPETQQAGSHPPGAATDRPPAGQSCRDLATRTYGAHSTTHGVRFVQPGDPQHSIHVAGEFNGWSATATPLRYDARLCAHQTLIEIPPGRYQYRLVIDGWWRSDPYNAHEHRNEYGEPNSVLVVPESQAPR